MTEEPNPNGPYPTPPALLHVPTVFVALALNVSQW